MFTKFFRRDQKELVLPSFLFTKRNVEAGEVREGQTPDPAYFSVGARWLWDNVSASSYRLS